jgi:hypothetical protein
MPNELATAYRIIPARPGDLQDRWAVPMPPRAALPQLSWYLLFLMRMGYYGPRHCVTEAQVRRLEPSYPPDTLRRALQQLVAAGYLVPLDRGLQEGRP